jgi:excisionase family DNA binding protein
MSTKPARITAPRRRSPRGDVPRKDAKTLTVEQFAVAVQIGRTKAFDLVRSGAVFSVKIGPLRRVPRWAVDSFLGGPPTA